MSVFTKPDPNILEHDPDYQVALNYALFHSILNDVPEAEDLILKLLEENDMSIKKVTGTDREHGAKIVITDGCSIEMKIVFSGGNVSVSVQFV